MAKQLLKNEAEVRKFLIGNGMDTINAPLVYALDYTMAKIVERNRELVLRIIYDGYEPSVYERTNQFLDSWLYTINPSSAGKTKVSGLFTQDTETMRVDNDKGQHGSPLENGPDWWYDAREYLADIIYNGNAGHAFGRGPWTRKRDVWKPLMKTVNSKIYKWYRDGLQKAGMVLTK